MENIRTASALLKVLMEEGRVTRSSHKDLFISYISEVKIEEILSTMTEELDAEVLRVNNTLYLVPSSENELLGFRHRDTREWFGTAARQADAFLAYYITALILNLFFGGKNRDPKQREFISLVHVVEEMDKRVSEALKNREKTEEMDRQYSMNFEVCAQVWDIKKGHEEGSRRTTKMGFLLSVVRLLQQEGLLRISENEKEVRTTEKLDDLMLHYYLREDRVSEIQKIFQEVDHA
jgi:predicted transcriptional regulator